LRATIVSCVDAQDLRTFLNSDDRFSKFYSTQSQWKEVSTEKIPLSTVDADESGPQCQDHFLPAIS
jgi:phage anti-repressor protein